MFDIKNDDDIDSDLGLSDDLGGTNYNGTNFLNDTPGVAGVKSNAKKNVHMNPLLKVQAYSLATKD